MRKAANMLVLLASFAACGGGDRKAQQDYEVIEEGSAGGVASSIAGPGEALPPITGTNAGTTSAFSIDPDSVPEAETGSIAETLPPMTSAAPPAAAPAAEPPAAQPPSSTAPRTIPAVPQPQPTEPVPSEPELEEPEPEEPLPPDTTNPPTQTDTNPPPPQTDTQEPPPPPPPARPRLS